MKLLNTTQEDVSPEIMALLADKFEEDSGGGSTKGLLHRQVMDGAYQFRIVGRSMPQYAVWFYVQADNVLHVNALLSLSKENKLSDGGLVLESLAKELGCSGITLTTRFKGLIRECNRQGYKQSAVVMRKELV